MGLAIAQLGKECYWKVGHVENVGSQKFPIMLGMPKRDLVAEGDLLDKLPILVFSRFLVLTSLFENDLVTIATGPQGGHYKIPNRGPIPIENGGVYLDRTTDLLIIGFRYMTALRLRQELIGRIDFAREALEQNPLIPSGFMQDIS